MRNKGITVGLDKLSRQADTQITNREQNTAYFNESMEELANLCHACDIEVVATLTQKSSYVHSSYYIGTGKIKELRDLIEETGAWLVICNQELTPSQIRNIERETNAKVLDRTSLILNIFSERARTRESKIQVEVARLHYELPRLVQSELNLERQSGGVGTKNRGSGEKKIELDRRRIEEKITALNRELEALQIQRKTRNSKRGQSEVPKAALVGYTNAGKSTVMNTLLSMSGSKEDKKVLQKDMLFATLDTSTRKIQTGNYNGFLLSDTVGFVSELPHHLVKAFRSTLQEVQEADVLLHIIDRSNPNWKQQCEVTEKTLEEIGAGHIPMIYVYNKTDKLEQFTKDDAGIYISAQTGEGMDLLLKTVTDKLYDNYVECNLLLPYTKGKATAELIEKASVLNMEHREEGVFLTLKWTQEGLDNYKSYVVSGISDSTL